ncbi:hypothetical protein BN1058_00767 [Paraliobacillus sp. PM-2]|uniref:hypothetical protein n=1 Tax=Paraliobacillus sp. PM-2 TaxID=1462524 RepID=UPI00061CCA1A|nr:hypothetical protein [Paraliobacillus sp. PM-2]CQR46506.1 hypothetical protein BN1058_00767 [Paraliobacillus sp. PM-2]
MNEPLLPFRPLTIDDYDLVRNMQTGIQDDYVLHIFPDLIQSKTQALFGWFDKNRLVSIAGYSIFPGGYAMLGRLRSDIRFRENGHATSLLAYIIDMLIHTSSVNWIGANTNIHNYRARKVLKKLHLDELTTLYSFPVKANTIIKGKEGEIWTKITSLTDKRKLIKQLKIENALHVYPFECYYPMPYSDALLTDEELAHSTFYLNPTNDRFMIIKNDQKREWFAHVKYFWNDHFEQAGFWNTINHHVNHDGLHPRPWFDFSKEGVANIPNIKLFDVSDGWILYGKWINVQL